MNHAACQAACGHEALASNRPRVIPSGRLALASPVGQRGGRLLPERHPPVRRALTSRR
jgi:hypothetical protein